MMHVICIIKDKESSLVYNSMLMMIGPWLLNSMLYNILL